MHFPSGIPQKAILLECKAKKDVSADSLLKDCMLNSYGVTESEKTDSFSGFGALKTPEASQSSEDQESNLLASALDSQVGLPEVSRQKRRRRRTAPQELAILEEEYLKDERPNLLNRERIAAKINSMSTSEDKMGSREIQVFSIIYRFHICNVYFRFGFKINVRQCVVKHHVPFCPMFI